MNDKNRIRIIAENITYYRKQKGVTQKELAKQVGVTPSTMSDYMNYRSAPSFGVIQKLADYFEVKKSDIDTTFREEEQSSPTPQVIELDRELKEPRHSVWISHGEELLAEQTAEQNKIIPLFDNQLEDEGLFPVQGTTFSAAASGFGYGYEADDYDTYTVYTDEEPPRRYDYAIGIRGDSMLPKYKQGDMLYIIDKGMSNYSGQLCIVVHNGQTYFKKVYTEDDGLRLVSLNKKYNDIFIDYPPAEDTYIKIYDVVGSFTPIEM